MAVGARAAAVAQCHSARHEPSGALARDSRPEAPRVEPASSPHPAHARVRSPRTT